MELVIWPVHTRDHCTGGSNFWEWWGRVTAVYCIHNVMMSCRSNIIMQEMSHGDTQTLGQVL